MRQFKKLRWVLPVLVCLWAPTLLQARESVVGRVALEQEQRMPAVSLRVNGKGPFLFFLSTTARETLIDEAVASELGLKALGRVRLDDADDPDSPEGDRVRVHLGVGDLEIEDVKAVRLELDQRFSGGEEAGGVLAYPTLSGYLWTLDLAESQFIVRTGQLPPSDGKSIVDYTLDGGTSPTLHVRLADQEMSMRLDTLLFGSVGLHTDQMDVLPLAPGSGMIGMSQQGDETFALLGGVLEADLRIGSQVLQRPKLIFSDGARHSSIGASALRDYALTFDPAHRRVKFERKESGMVRRLHAQAAQVAGLPGPGTLREAFNRNSDQVRLLFILSPVCPGCVHGAKVMQEMLAGIPSDRVVVHVVWTPVVPGDNLEEARKARALISDPRAVHYWDPEQHLGLAYGTVLELPRGRQLAWDIYFTFDPGVKWDDRVPAPNEWVHQLGLDERRLDDGSRLQAAIEATLSRIARNPS